MNFRGPALEAVKHRVGVLKERVDPGIQKTAADMVVPFERFGEMMRVYRDGYERRGLPYAIWGHVSDGNVHPNVIPRTVADVRAGQEAILEFGREAIARGGSPLSEHGVGRSAVKQALLRQLYGERGLEEMRAVKAALDPDWGSWRWASCFRNREWTRYSALSARIGSKSGPSGSGTGRIRGRRPPRLQNCDSDVAASGAYRIVIVQRRV